MTSSVLIRSRFGGWNEGLRAAGLTPRPLHGRKIPKPKQISDETCDAAIRLADKATDKPLTSRSYVAWRKQVLLDPECELDFNPPSLETLMNRFGSVDAIRNRAEELARK